MRVALHSIGLRSSLAIFVVTVLLTTTCAATEKILHSFKHNGRDGNNPIAGLIFDAKGNLYGTAIAGGVYGYGRRPKRAGAGRRRFCITSTTTARTGTIPEPA